MNQIAVDNSDCDEELTMARAWRFWKEMRCSWLESGSQAHPSHHAHMEQAGNQ